MERFDNIIRRKVEIHDLCLDKLSHILDFQNETQDCSSSYWLTSAMINENYLLDDIIQSSKKRNIEIRRGFYPIHTMPPYQSFEKCDLNNTNAISSKIVCLPSSPNLNAKDISYINSQLINHVFK